MAGKETTGFRTAFRPTPHTKITDLLKAYPDMIERPCVVKHPGISRDILSFGIVKDHRLDGTNVSLDLQIPTQHPDVIAKVQTAVREAVSAFVEIGEVHIQAQARPSPRYGALVVAAAPDGAEAPAFCDLAGKVRLAADAVAKAMPQLIVQ